MLTYVMIGLGLWNLIVTAIYGLDKFFAMKEKERISEFSLLFFAFCFAGLGALLGMVLCQHKTRKWKFRVLIPLAVLWETFSLGYAYFYFS